MDNFINILVQIEKDIQQVATCNANGLAVLHLTMTTASLRELLQEINKYMHGSENLGQQPQEIIDVVGMVNIHHSIVDM